MAMVRSEQKLDNFPKYLRSDIREHFGFLASYDAHRSVVRTITVCPIHQI